MLKTDFETRNVLLDLLDEGQMLRQFRRIARQAGNSRLIDARRAGGDESGIELVVLGPVQMHTRIGLHLHRLQDENGKALVPQIPDHAAFVAAGRLDADSCHPGFGKFCGQAPPAGRCVVNLPALGPAIHCSIKLRFRCIDFPPSC